jgi:hypothetical protein
VVIGLTTVLINKKKESTMIKERKLEIRVDSRMEEEAIIKMIEREGYFDITSLSHKLDVYDNGDALEGYYVCQFMADKHGEDIESLFRDLCESLDTDGQNEMGALEYEYAEEFDRDEFPVYTHKLFQTVCAALREKGYLK